MPYYSYDRRHIRYGYRQRWRSINHYARAMQTAVFRIYVRDRNRKMIRWMLRNWDALFHQLRDSWIREGLRYASPNDRRDMMHLAQEAADEFQHDQNQDDYLDL